MAYFELAHAMTMVLYILTFNDSLQVAVSDCPFLVIVNSLHPLLIAERRERSEANNWGLFKIPRYLHLHCTRPCTPYTSPTTSTHCALPFATLAAV